MSDEQVWGEDLPGIGKRRLEAVDGDEESARKAHKRTAPTNSWFNSSFSMPDQRVSAKAGNVVLTAARSVPWIRPAFSREPTPVAVPPVLSASRRQEASTSAAARTNVQNAAPRDASSWTEGIVLFGPGNNKELKEGMTVGVWKPWGDVLDKPLKSPIEGLEEGLPPANSDEQPNKDEAPHKVTESEPEELPESVIEDQNAIILTKEDEPMNVDALRPQEKPPGATPALGPRALLVTRYLILD
ncbi:hypothetical protein CALCODRAFT_487032 [Calocera cornea HHB12733]|uniref:Uncharacterized protein n=1 Tax=Calocera cornea HHB12733 TaxID=1353952 RepID=A0A165DDI7_9BASI|nr:hypothetical protein CALCODRAFT_487032 [Calocera cornea HHB12733]